MGNLTQIVRNYAPCVGDHKTPYEGPPHSVANQETRGNWGGGGEKRGDRRRRKRKEVKKEVKMEREKIAGELKQKEPLMLPPLSPEESEEPKNLLDEIMDEIIRPKPTRLETIQSIETPSANNRTPSIKHNFHFNKESDKLKENPCKRPPKIILTTYDENEISEEEDIQQTINKSISDKAMKVITLKRFFFEIDEPQKQCTELFFAESRGLENIAKTPTKNKEPFDIGNALELPFSHWESEIKRFQESRRIWIVASESTILEPHEYQDDYKALILKQALPGEILGLGRLSTHSTECRKSKPRTKCRRTSFDLTNGGDNELAGQINLSLKLSEQKKEKEDIISLVDEYLSTLFSEINDDKFFEEEIRVIACAFLTSLFEELEEIEFAMYFLPIESIFSYKYSEISKFVIKRQILVSPDYSEIISEETYGMLYLHYPVIIEAIEEINSIEIIPFSPMRIILIEASSTEKHDFITIDELILQKSLAIEPQFDASMLSIFSLNRPIPEILELSPLSQGIALDDKEKSSLLLMRSSEGHDSSVDRTIDTTQIEQFLDVLMLDANLSSLKEENLLDRFVSEEFLSDLIPSALDTYNNGTCSTEPLKSAEPVSVRRINLRARQEDSPLRDNIFTARELSDNKLEMLQLFDDRYKFSKDMFYKYEGLLQELKRLDLSGPDSRFIDFTYIRNSLYQNKFDELEVYDNIVKEFVGLLLTIKTRRKEIVGSVTSQQLKFEDVFFVFGLDFEENLTIGIKLENLSEMKDHGTIVYLFFYILIELNFRKLQIDLGLHNRINIVIDFFGSEFSLELVHQLLRLNKVSFPDFLKEIYLINLDLGEVIEHHQSVEELRRLERSVKVLPPNFPKVLYRVIQKNTVSSTYFGELDEELFDINSVLSDSIMETLG